MASGLKCVRLDSRRHRTLNRFSVPNNVFIPLVFSALVFNAHAAEFEYLRLYSDARHGRLQVKVQHHASCKVSRKRELTTRI